MSSPAASPPRVAWVTLALTLALCATAAAETPPEPVDPITAARDRVHAAKTAATPTTWLCTSAERRALRRDLARAHALSDEAAGHEWRESALLRDLVHILPDTDETYWRDIRRLYLAKKICRPAELLTDGMVTVHAFGHEIRGQGDVAIRLLRADRALAEQGARPSFTWIGGFSPRPVRGTMRLSKHALGLAIDFDPKLNPYLTRGDMRLIHKVTRVRIRRGLRHPPGRRWDDFRKAHVRFSERIGPWFEAAQRKRARLRDNSRAARRLDRDLELLTTAKNARILHTGILSLSKPFVEEMERAGLRWRTDFSAGPDLMHFSR